MEFILDMAKWRCGQEHPTNSLGKGPTALLNNEGYMCCLGQFSKQVDGTTDADLRCAGEPSQLKESFFKDTNVFNYNTELANESIRLNDSGIRIPFKVKCLRLLYKDYGHTIKVINIPPKYQEEIQPN